MGTDEIADKLRSNLTDVHSIEEQALVQMRRAPEIAGSEAIAQDFATHLRETEEQERAVRERLADHDAEPSTIKDLAGRAGGVGMALFADSQPDTPVKLIAHAYSYEHLEVAAYELLGAVAELAGDQRTAEMARRIGAEERQMAERLQQRFSDAVEETVGELAPADLADKLDAYLSDAHAIEEQAIQMLAAGGKLVDDAELELLFSEHQGESERHRDLLEEQLDRRGADSSSLKDAMLRLGALNLGAFFKLQPDSNAKLAGFAFAFEHLEIAIYSMLAEVARRADDQQVVAMAEEILGSERSTADALGAALSAVLRREYAEQLA